MKINIKASESPPIYNGFFHVGGKYIDNGEGGHIMVGQMYVEHWKPPLDSEVRHPYPLILIHGYGQTGTNWLQKPDGGDGWAFWFLRRGYDVYLIDQICRGRSAWPAKSNEQPISISAEIVEQRFTAVSKYHLWPQSALHTRWPGTGVRGDPIFENFYAATMQSLFTTSAVEASMQEAGVALLERIGAAIIIAHSQGGIFAWLWADSRPDLVKAMVNLEPTGPPFKETVFTEDPTRKYGLTNIPVMFGPADDSATSTQYPLGTYPTAAPDNKSRHLQREPAMKLVNLSKVPQLMVTSEASYHAVYDHLTAEFLRQAGVNVEHIRLEEEEIHGNGHMLFMETNSDDIAAIVERWVIENVSSK